MESMNIWERRENFKNLSEIRSSLKSLSDIFFGGKMTTAGEPRGSAGVEARMRLDYGGRPVTVVPTGKSPFYKSDGRTTVEFLEVEVVGARRKTGLARGDLLEVPRDDLHPFPDSAYRFSG